MSELLLNLPVEIRKEIFEKSRKRDLVNLAACSRFWKDEIVPIIWKNVTVKWEDLVERRVNTKTMNLKHTRKLTFSGGGPIRGYKNFAFAFIIHNCDPNQLISLSVDRYIVPDGLHLVAEMLPMLRSLHLDSIDERLSEDLLLNFELLERVSLRGCRLTDDHVKNICRLKNLRALEVVDFSRYTNITGLSLEYISHVTELKELLLDADIEKTVMEQSCVSENIPKLRKLVRLEMEIPDFEIDENFFKFAGRDFNGLKILKIRYSRLSIFLPSVLKLHNLRRLDLADCYEINDKDVASIHQLHKLEYLNLNGSGITDEGIQHVSKLVSLRSLELFECEDLTDVSLHYISQLRNLEFLNISINDNYTDEGFAVIGNLRFLKVLQMSNLYNLTDESLKVVSNLVYLEELDIVFNNELTNDGIMHLTNLKYLKTLDWYDCKGLTKDGVKRAGF